MIATVPVLGSIENTVPHPASPKQQQPATPPSEVVPNNRPFRSIRLPSGASPLAPPAKAWSTVSAPVFASTENTVPSSEAPPAIVTPYNVPFTLISAGFGSCPSVHFSWLQKE